MLNLPFPDLILEDIYELKPEMLNNRGIKLLLMDLDNTLAPYSTNKPSVQLLNWIDSLKKAGIEPFIISNNKGDRPETFAKALGIDYIGRARKPSIKKLLITLANKSVPPAKTAIIGDQIYTDVLCGKRVGIYTIAVQPIDMTNPFHLLRYGFERPFRRGRKVKTNISMEIRKI